MASHCHSCRFARVPQLEAIETASDQIAPSSPPTGTGGIVSLVRRPLPPAKNVQQEPAYLSQSINGQNLHFGSHRRSTLPSISPAMKPQTTLSPSLPRLFPPRQLGSLTSIKGPTLRQPSASQSPSGPMPWPIRTFVHVVCFN